MKYTDPRKICQRSAVSASETLARRLKKIYVYIHMLPIIYTCFNDMHTLDFFS